MKILIRLVSPQQMHQHQQRVLTAVRSHFVMKTPLAKQIQKISLILIAFVIMASKEMDSRVRTLMNVKEILLHAVSMHFV